MTIITPKKFKTPVSSGDKDNIVLRAATKETIYYG